MTRKQLRQIHQDHSDEILAQNSVQPCACENCVLFRREEEELKRVALALYPRLTYDEIFDKVETTPIGQLKSLYREGVVAQSDQFVPVHPRMEYIPPKLSLWEKVKMYFTTSMTANDETIALVNEMNAADVERRKQIRRKLEDIFIKTPYTPEELSGVDPDVWDRVSAHMKKSFQSMQSQIIMDDETIKRIRSRGQEAEMLLLNLLKATSYWPDSEKRTEVKDAYKFLKEGDLKEQL
jgi:hypothetical protein